MCDAQNPQSPNPITTANCDFGDAIAALSRQSLSSLFLFTSRVIGDAEPGTTTEVDETTPTPKEFGAIDAALRRLYSAGIYEGLVQWSLNHEGIDFADRVKRIVVRNYVVKIIGEREIGSVSAFS